MKTISRYIMTLALLLTAASGAWAQTQITITQGFEDGMGDWTMNHCQSNTGINSAIAYEGSNCFRFYYTTNYPQYLISPELDENDGGTMSFYYARESSNYTESFKVGYSTTTSEPSAFTWGNEKTVSNGDGGDFFNYTYNFPAGTKYVSIACTSPDQFYLFIDDIKIEYVAAADPNAVEVTTNAAEEGATFTEASFDMPAFDATAEYELVRDMSVQMNVKVGEEGEDGFRIRVKKNEQQQFEPAEMQFDAMLALFTVNDEIEEKTLTFYGQTVDCKLSIYAVDENGEPTGDAITFNALTPGRYVAIATAADGSAYDGTTAPSNIFELYQGYEVEIAGGEFITYYKDEAIYVEDEDVQLFSITAVGENTATATQYDVIPANKAMLVKNNSAEPKTVLLIPTETDPLSFTWYDGFVGTLEATTILASDATTDRYAFNGKQFVRVKNDLAVGANKAWLEIPAANNARIINISFEETTGIHGTNWANEANGTWYDLNGRKLDAVPTKKGVYILNGRKVVVK